MCLPVNHQWGFAVTLTGRDVQPEQELLAELPPGTTPLLSSRTWGPRPVPRVCRNIQEKESCSYSWSVGLSYVCTDFPTGL